MPLIRPVNFQRQWEVIGTDVLEAVRQVGESGHYILSTRVERFERHLANSMGRQHAVGVGNGLDAIQIALMAYGIQPGDKVLTTPLSAFATTLAILRCGAIPIFVDCDTNGNIDLELCREALASKTDIRFFVPVHLYGNPLDFYKLKQIKIDYTGLTIVEDAAQAYLAVDSDQMVGSIGHATAISFYPTKNLGTVGGDAGAILIDNGEKADVAKCLRNYGQSSQYTHDHIGINSRLDEIHAAVLDSAILPHIPKFTETRRCIAQKYHQALGNRFGARTLKTSPTANPVYHLFPVFIPAEHIEAARNILNQHEIWHGSHYPRTIPDQPCMVKATWESVGTLDVAKRLASEIVTIPIHPYLTTSEINQVCEALTCL